MVKDKDILVQIEDGKWIKFVKIKLGLYIYDMIKGFSTYNNNNTQITLPPYSLLHTFSKNAELIINKVR